MADPHLADLLALIAGQQHVAVADKFIVHIEFFKDDAEPVAASGVQLEVDHCAKDSVEEYGAERVPFAGLADGVGEIVLNVYREGFRAPVEREIELAADERAVAQFNIDWLVGFAAGRIAKMQDDVVGIEGDGVIVIGFDLGGVEDFAQRLVQ